MDRSIGNTFNVSKEQNTQEIERRRFPPYPEYKDSGVEWLGEIPKHWRLMPLKHICTRSALYGANEPADTYIEKGVRFLRTTDISDQGDLMEDGVYLSVEAVSDFLLQTGDLLFSRSGTIGRSFLYDQEKHGPCAYAGYLVRFVPGPEFFPLFGFYLTKSLHFEHWAATAVISSTIGNLNAQKYANMPCPKPPLTEQIEISRFLDSETAKIDAFIEKKERLIELLQEKRTALITQAVTKGLDPTVPMTDSGVEWLGDIPKHWEARRLKFVLSAPLKYGANEAAELEEPDLPRYVRITDIDENDGLRDETFKSLPDEVAKEYLLREGDILFARSGATAGKTFLYRKSWGTCAYAGYLIRARLDNEKASPEFIRYFTASIGYWQWLASVFIQATIQNVSAERYASLSLPLPPLSEQRTIAAFLDSKAAKIYTLILRIREAITYLRDYRTALISAAVTGKIDVREACVLTEILIKG